MLTKNDDHKMYASWDMECDKHNFLSSWDIFWSFTLLLTMEIKILKKRRKNVELLSFTHVYHKWRSYNVCFLRYKGTADTVFCHLEPFLLFDPPNNPKNQSFEKNRKSSWRNSHFTLVYHKWQSYDVWFLTHGAWQTDLFVPIFTILELHFALFRSWQPVKSKLLKYEKNGWRCNRETHMCTKNEDHIMYGS